MSGQNKNPLFERDSSGDRRMAISRLLELPPWCLASPSRRIYSLPVALPYSQNGKGWNGPMSVDHCMGKRQVGARQDTVFRLHPLMKS